MLRETTQNILKKVRIGGLVLSIRNTSGNVTQVFTD